MIAKFLNETCACKTFDLNLFKSHLASDPELAGICKQIIEDRPHLFSATTVYLSSSQFKAMEKIINAIEETLKLSTFKSLAFSNSLPISHQDQGPRGVCMGYDFHLGDEGPKIIEINTNAGGPLLNLELARAQTDCCNEFNLFSNASDRDFFEMFLQEWKLIKADSELKLIAIVDDAPESQYLNPEFKLFVRLFKKFGLKAVIADPKDLIYKNDALYFQEEKVDLIYNRLTDFYLEQEAHQEIKKAYELNQVALTPAPIHHALFANKKNLKTLTDTETLNQLGVSLETQKTLLAGIPKTEIVSKDKAEVLWARRRNLFFKPVAGYGGKATYRGDKVTHKVWDEILDAEYVAQELIAPSKRVILKDGIKTDLKVDIRAYTYGGKIQLLAARLYSGQTTNFRTEGGGFAPVFVVQDQSESS